MCHYPHERRVAAGRKRNNTRWPGSEIVAPQCERLRHLYGDGRPRLGGGGAGYAGRGLRVEAAHLSHPLDSSSQKVDTRSATTAGSDTPAGDSCLAAADTVLKVADKLWRRQAAVWRRQEVVWRRQEAVSWARIGCAGRCNQLADGWQQFTGRERHFGERECGKDGRGKQIGDRGSDGSVRGRGHFEKHRNLKLLRRSGLVSGMDDAIPGRPLWTAHH